MGCGCGGSRSSTSGYKIKYPDGTSEYTTNIAEAKIKRAAHDTPHAVIVMQVSLAEAEQAMQDAAPVG